MVGEGLSTSRVIGDPAFTEVVVPVSTEMESEAPLARELAGTVAVSCVALTYCVGTDAPFT
jgi:hypothetical protein